MGQAYIYIKGYTHPKKSDESKNLRISFMLELGAIELVIHAWSDLLTVVIIPELSLSIRPL
jgi:hypothetical protein